MSKDKKKKQHPKEYFEVLKLFHLAPDFHLQAFEKDVFKYLDKEGPKTSYEIADAFDLRPSEVKEVVSSLTDKGVLQTGEDGYVSLTEMAIKYARATKEERKTEKKFRKFLDTLDSKDIEKFLGYVNSFEIKDGDVINLEEVTESVNEEIPAEAEENKEE